MTLKSTLKLLFKSPTFKKETGLIWCRNKSMITKIPSAFYHGLAFYVGHECLCHLKHVHKKEKKNEGRDEIEYERFQHI